MPDADDADRLNWALGWHRHYHARAWSAKNQVTTNTVSFRQPVRCGSAPAAGTAALPTPGLAAEWDEDVAVPIPLAIPAETRIRLNRSRTVNARISGGGRLAIQLLCKVCRTGDTALTGKDYTNMKNDTASSLDDQAELVSRAQNADEGAFGELMRRTSGSSLRLATSILKNHHLAEEEVQNAYLKAWCHIGQFQGESHFSTWMSRIVANQCLMHLRSLRFAKVISLDGATDVYGQTRSRDIADHRANAEALICGRGELVALSREIKKLPSRLRCALILRDVKELSTSEAAKTLGISAAALKSRLLRARVVLRQRLTVGTSQRQAVRV